MTPNHDWEEILRAAHNDPLDPAHYTAVRARVLAEIERTHNPWRRLAWLSGAAALALLFFLPLPSRRPQLPPLRAVSLAIPTAPPAPVTRSRPRPLQVATAARLHREAVTIKLQTNDPNIVIYWIAE